MLRNNVAVLIASCVALICSGCATYRTVEKLEPGSPTFFSGTRLDYAALSGNKVAILKHHVEPPKYPLIDLPFSFVADIFASSGALPITMYDEMYKNNH